MDNAIRQWNLERQGIYLIQDRVPTFLPKKYSYDILLKAAHKI
jgi:hypothetical protein